MGRFWWLVIACAACGRVGFDPLGDTGGTRDSGTSSTPDAPPPPGDTCATVIDMTLGVPLANQTLDGARDDYAATGVCGNGPEVVLRISVPTAGSRTISMTGTFTGGVKVGAACPPVNASCGLLGAGGSVGLNFAAGVNYVTLDRVGGTGTMFTLTVQ